MRKKYHCLLLSVFLLTSSILTANPEKVSANAKQSFSFTDSDFFMTLPEICISESSFEKQMEYAFLYEKLFLPSLSFSASGQAYGKELSYSSEFYRSAELSPSVVVSQLIPGGGTVQLSLSVPFSCSYEAGTASDDFYWTINPSLGVSLPLSFSSGFAKNYGMLSKRKFARKKEIAFLSKTVSDKKALKNFFGLAKDFLYCLLLEEAYCEKENLLEFQFTESEKLYEMGRINSIEINRLQNEKQEFLQTKMENLTKKIDLHSSLIVYGKAFLKAIPSENQIDFYKEFINQWENFSQENQMESNFEKELELSSLEDSFASELEDYIDDLPYFSASIYAKGDNQKFSDEVDFSKPAFGASFSVTFPVWPKNVFQKTSGIFKKSKFFYENERNLFENEAEVLKLSRSGLLAQIENFVETMKSSEAFEEKRLENMSALNESGRLSDFDIKVQKNNLKIARLKTLNARAMLVELKLGFY